MRTVRQPRRYGSTALPGLLGGLEADRIVEGLNEGEDRHASLSLRGGAPAVGQLAFAGREEALGHSIVVIDHRPPHDPSASHIQDHGEIEEAAAVGT